MSMEHSALIPHQTEPPPSSSWSNFLNKARGVLKTCKKKLGCGGEEGIDCTVHENALRIFGLSEEESQNRDTVDRQYTILNTAWSTRLKGAKDLGSKPLEQKFQMLLTQVQIAYRTLTQTEVPPTP